MTTLHVEIGVRVVVMGIRSQQQPEGLANPLALVVDAEDGFVGLENLHAV
jgi:hypothetical protein